MKYVRLFEEYNKEALYEEVDIEYVRNYSSNVDVDNFTKKELEILYVPDNSSYTLYRNQCVDMRERRSVFAAWVFIIDKFRDDWFIVQYYRNKDDDKYYKCDTIEGVNKLIKDEIG